MSKTVAAAKPRKTFGQWCKSMRGQQILCTVTFLIVPLLLLFTFTYLPFFNMVEFSFFDMRYIGRREFVGLENYIEVFTREDCFQALLLSLYYMAGSVIQMALALLFATILSFKVKGSKFFRGALYFPCLICGIAVGFIFKFFFTHGFVLDTLLSWVGFDVDTLPYWLRDESINNIVLVACSIWKYVGQNIVMFIGAIASVDSTLYEAAEIDGANAWHKFKDIILPSIRTIVVLNLIISVSGALSAFEMPYVVTGGSFGTSTYFVIMDKLAHTDQKVGLASAMAIVLLALIMVVTWAQKRAEKWLDDRDSRTPRPWSRRTPTPPPRRPAPAPPTRNKQGGCKHDYIQCGHPRQKHRHQCVQVCAADLFGLCGAGPHRLLHQHRLQDGGGVRRHQCYDPAGKLAQL